MTDSTADSPGGRRAPTWWPFAGALAIVLVLVVVFFLAGPGKDRTEGSERDSSGALVCPSAYQLGKDPWVPQEPAGVDGSKRLVPTVAPDHATVCSYTATRGQLDASLTDIVEVDRTATKVLTGGRDALARELSAVRPAKRRAASCFETPTSYLVGLVYRTGTVWVTSVHSCGFTSNGDFRGDVVPVARFETAITTGSWPG